MSLRFLSDQCVPAAVTTLLRQAGYDVVLLRDVLPTRSPDEIVIAKAQEQRRILISLNGDFSDIVTYPPAQYLGIVAIQLHNHPEILGRLMHQFTAYLRAQPSQQHYDGKLLIVEAHRIRIRQ